MNKKGKLIVFEGLDGSGKTTQINLLKQNIEKAFKDIDCTVTREPTDMPVGRTLRQALSHEILLKKETIALLFAADRFEHITKEIKPLLESGVTVLCDRYYFSSLAYQSLDIDMEKVLVMNEINISAQKADLTIYLDVEPKECMQRIAKERDQAELFENLKTLERVRGNFFKAFDILNERVKIIKPLEKQEDTAELVLKAVNKIII